MKINAEDITSFLTFRHPLSALKGFDYPYSISFNENLVDFKTAKIETEKYLLEAVQKQMRQSEKPAVAMSGGLDSVTMVALMKQIGPTKKIRLYTARFKGDSEYQRAIEIAKYFDLPHRVIEIIPDDYLNEELYLKPLVRHKKEPLHPNEIALTKIENVAKEDGCDTVFCGEGGDDLFGGYSKLLTLFKSYYLSKDNFLGSLLGFYRYFSLTDRQRIIKPEYLTDDVEILHNALGPTYQNVDIRHIVFYFIQKVHTPGLLKRGINAIEYNGLKSAFPYVEGELVAYINSLPFEYKIFGNVSKYILREIALKYIPHKFAYGVKHPFPVPFDSWLNDINEWNLDERVFLFRDISMFNGWKKWMLINLNAWVKEN